MKKTARLLFLLIGCIFPIFIGGLHTFVHFSELLSSDIQEYLMKEFLILGEMQSLWNTWGVVSFMMGVAFIIIGLLNISILIQTPKTKNLPILPLLAMLLYQLAVSYVGFEFEQAFQLYGGLFGVALMVICLILTIQSKAVKP